MYLLLVFPQIKTGGDYSFFRTKRGQLFERGKLNEGDNGEDGDDGEG